MTNETIQTETAKANDESRANHDQQTSLSLKRIKVAHSAQHVSSRTGYGILVGD